jgi:hypothetical protein
LYRLLDEKRECFCVKNGHISEHFPVQQYLFSVEIMDEFTVTDTIGIAGSPYAGDPEAAKCPLPHPSISRCISESLYCCSFSDLEEIFSSSPVTLGSLEPFFMPLFSDGS